MPTVDREPPENIRMKDPSFIDISDVDHEILEELDGTPLPAPPTNRQAGQSGHRCKIIENIL
jgi:hypothetical protein